MKMALSRKEADELKPQISGIVEKVLGFSDNSVVVAAIQCLQKDMDKGRIIEHLQPLMDKSAKKFVEELYTTVELSKTKKKSRKRKEDEVETAGTKKVRRFVEPDIPVALPAEPIAESPGMLTTQQIKNMMEHARKQIEQRKEQLKMMDPADIRAQAEAAKISNGSEQQALIESSMTKAEKAAELQRKIQEKLAARPGLLSAPPSTPEAMTSLIAKITGKVGAEESAPKPLILDDQGRTVDATGQLLNIPQRVPTLKANIRAKKREEFRQKMLEKPEEESSSEVKTFYDPRVPQEGPTRQKRQFKFYDKGRFVQIAQKIRTKTQLEKLQNEIAQAAKKTGIQQASKLALIAPKAVVESGQIPDLEWWDEYLIPQESSIDTSEEKYHGITNLIEHPTQMDPPGEKKEVTMGLFLTKKERKKLRRLNRREAMKDEQEKVRLGLAPAPEPKVKLSNLMRVLGNDAVQDPTKVEQHVRAQMAKRKREHEQANAARKLTTEQRKEKKMKKLKEDVSSGVHVAIYRVKSLRDPAKKFKIEANSNQLYMTGCVVLFKDINVVVVEGGPKAQRKFQRLMMIRMKWADEKKWKRDEGEESGPNSCQLIWEGQSKSKNFGPITVKQCLTELAAREFFKKHGVEHYWDLAHSTKILEE
ncbi:U4/U6 small nuclear ribonucleoprotein Prp3-like [Styela clava]